MDKFLDILKAVGPAVIAAQWPILTPVIPKIIEGIAGAEVFRVEEGEEPPTGPQKRDAAMKVVEAGASSLEAVRPGTLGVSVVDFMTTTGHAIDATVGVVNMIKRAPEQPPITFTPVQP